MSADLNNSYDDLKSKIGAAKTYTEATASAKDSLKGQGDMFEQKLSDGQTSLDSFKVDKSRIQQDVKSQFSQLFDISALTGGKGKSSISYLKNKFLLAMNQTKPQIKNIIIEEVIKAINCSAQQQFTPNSSIYVNINSIDFFKQLQINPNDKRGRLYYEKKQFSATDVKKSLNKELYNRIQNPNVSFQDDPNNDNLLYQGGSGQDLFNITYVTQDNNGNSGSFFKVDLSQRITTSNIGDTANIVSDFVTDYYSSIEVVEVGLAINKIIDSLTGVLSLNAGTKSVDANLKLNKFIQRILGLCFDSAQEIDTQGSSKIPELDGISENFFELTSLNLRSIEEEKNRFYSGIIELTDCDNVQLPIDTELLLNNLDEILSGATLNDEITAADKLTDTLLSAARQQATIDITKSFPAYSLSIDTSFVKNIPAGLVFSILSPKLILPLIVMIKAIGQAAGQSIDYAIDNLEDFFKEFSKFTTNIISKIASLFVEILFDLIKKDIFNLLQAIVKDLAREKADIKYIIAVKLVQLLITVSSFIKDYRRCKSVVDELINLFRILLSGWGGEIPLPLLSASRLLDGYSYTRAFMGAIEELQKLGVPTGNLPSGAPNMFVLSKLGQMKAMAEEEAANGKVQVAIPPLAVVAAGGGSTMPASGFGKKL
jgi:hypothetical protein